MATQISDNAQPESRLVLPPELMLMVTKSISGFNWPDSWNLRLACHTWKFEVEKLFRQRYLPNMTIMVSLSRIEEFPYYEFEFAKISGELAIFKLRGGAISDTAWKIIVSNLRLGSTELRDRDIYRIRLPALYIVNNTELVGLQEDDSAQTISTKWLPTLDVLFREERKLRELARADAEYVFRKILFPS